MNPCQYILEAKKPTFIPVADKPPRLGGIVENLAIEEFERQFGCTYHDGISISSKSVITPFRESITSDIPSSELKKQVKRVLNTTQDYLAICKMGKLGYGVFALKKIPKDTVVAIYAGTIISGQKITDEKDHALGYYGTNMSISTKNHRGIASFFQHLPEEPRVKDAKSFSNILKMMGQDVSEEQLKLNIEFYSTEFKTNQIRNIISTENIRKEFLNIDNIPVVAMVTSKPIQSGDQLGLNYGYGYWLTRNGMPEYIDKTGEVLSRELYKRTFGCLNFDKFSYTGEYAPLITLANQGLSQVSIKGDDKKTHIISVGKLAIALLYANACQLKVTQTT